MDLAALKTKELVSFVTIALSSALSKVTIKHQQQFGSCGPITNKWLLVDFWTLSPSDANEKCMAFSEKAFQQ